jgi:Fic family protein
MERGPTGHYEASIGGGERCDAFVPFALPPDPPLFIEPFLQELFDQAHLELGRLDSISTLLPDPPVFLYSYVRKEAVMSSQIEGTQSSLADLMLFEMDAAPGVPIDDVREVSSYVAALDHGLRRLREGFPLCLRLIKEMHALLMTHGRGAGKNPGEWRKVQNWIGGAHPGRASFVPPPPQQVEPCLAALEGFLNDQPSRYPPLLKAALAHVQFETIHPFLDGNGRLGRLLITLVLAHEQVLHDPLLYLSVYFKAHRTTYYDLLQKVRRDGDWEAWLTFFAEAVSQTARQAVATAQALNRLTREDRERLQALGRQAGSARLVHDALCARPVSDIADICQRTALSPNTVAKLLTSLEADLGMVREATGQRRNRVFVYGGYLELLNRELDD